jgi:hypothetical protein
VIESQKFFAPFSLLLPSKGYFILRKKDYFFDKLLHLNVLFKYQYNPVQNQRRDNSARENSAHDNSAHFQILSARKNV